MSLVQDVCSWIACAPFLQDNTVWYSNKEKKNKHELETELESEYEHSLCNWPTSLPFSHNEISETRTQPLLWFSSSLSLQMSCNWLCGFRALFELGDFNLQLRNSWCPIVLPCWNVHETCRAQPFRLNIFPGGKRLHWSSLHFWFDLFTSPFKPFPLILRTWVLSPQIQLWIIISFHHLWTVLSRICYPECASWQYVRTAKHTFTCKVALADILSPGRNFCDGDVGII